MTDESLSAALEVWRAWTRASSMKLGYPTKAAGLRFRSGNDWEDLADEVDNRIAHAVDVSVDELAPDERAAVHCVVLGACGLQRGDDLQETYLRARQSLWLRLEGRGVE